jgi:hypothetical protein
VGSARGFVLAAALLAATSCARTYYKDFVIEPQDRAYAARAQFDDLASYLRARGLRTVIETNNLLEVEIEPGDTLLVRLVPSEKVELTLTRRSKGPDFTAAEVRRFQETFAGRMREQTGRAVTIRLVDQGVKPLTNLQ